MSKHNLQFLIVGAFFALSLGLSATVLADEEKMATYNIVILTSGKRYEGHARRQGDDYKITLRDGQVVTVPASKVATVKTEVDAKTEYLSRKTEIDTKDASALYGLARWVWETFPEDKEMLQNARGDLKLALQIDPKYRRATLLLKQVDAALEKFVQKPTASTGGKVQFPMVSDADINMIRIREMRKDDKTLRIRFKNDLIDRYINMMQGRDFDDWDKRNNDVRFRKLSNLEQALDIRKNYENSKAILSDIEVLSDPQFMRDFRTAVWPVIKKNCATSRCHGGRKPVGGLIFATAGGTQEQRDYTNFIILTGFYTAAPHNYRLLDRQDVENSSLLLQYCLERSVANYRHPGNAVRTLWANRSARGYQRMLKWMRDLYGPMDPNYYLKWKPPFKMRVSSDGRSLSPAPKTPTTKPAPITELPN